jgi:putative spermidine/putrescine transport system substrate-binding protein
MRIREGSRTLSRREFLVRAGVAGAGASAAWARPWTDVAQAAPDLAGSGSVVVYESGGALGAAAKKALNDPFEAATGIKIVTSPGATVSRVRAGVQAGAPAHDVVAVDGAGMREIAREGLLTPIDYRWIDPADRAAFTPIAPFEYGVPSLFSSMVLTYNLERSNFGGTPPKTWADFWDVTRYPGKRTLATGSWGADSGVFEQALLADGVDPGKLYPLDLDRAVRSLERVRPSILKFWSSGAEPVQLLVDGQVTLATAWNGRVADLQAKGVKLANSWDQGILQYSYWIVPKGAKNRENAMKYIAFVTRPEQQAKLAELIPYGPTNSRAYQAISPERTAALPSAPALRQRQIVQDYEWWTNDAAPGKSNTKVAIELWEKWLTR